MKARLFILVCAAPLVILAGAAPVAAGEFSFGFGFGYSGCPAYGYFGYHSTPRPYIHGAYGPPVLYPVPVARPCCYAPYNYRVVPVYRPHGLKPCRGKHYGVYARRRYRRH